MTTPVEYVTLNKLAEDTGLSRSGINKLLDTGDIIHSKGGKRRNSGVMVNISSFNKYWKSKNIVKN